MGAVNPNFCHHVFDKSEVGEVSVEICQRCRIRLFTIWPMQSPLTERHVAALYTALTKTETTPCVKIHKKVRRVRHD